MNRISIFSDKERLKQTVAESKTSKEVMDRYQLNGLGSGNYKTFRKYLKLYDIDTSHFIKSHQNMVAKNKLNNIPLEDIISGKTEYQNISSLKKRLYNEGYKTPICELCGQGNIWNGLPLSLQLNHVDGDNSNHKLDNLEILCPNCHTQTETYGSKRLKKSK